MDKEEKDISALKALLIIMAIVLLVFFLFNFGKNELERESQGIAQNLVNEYKRTHILLPAEGLVVNKSYVAQHTDYVYGLFYSNSTTYPERYIITFQRTYEGKKISGEYAATEDEYRAAKKGAIFRDSIGSKMWFNLSDSN